MRVMAVMVVQISDYAISVLTFIAVNQQVQFTGQDHDR